jgi:hypothetical protein
MNTAEYIEAVRNTVLDQTRVKNIEEIYSTKINELVSKIISLGDTVDFFDEERRALSYVEISKPNEIMEIDFVSKRMIPLVDIYDNSYVVYLIEDKQYALYNAIDDMEFKRSNIFEDLLKG